MRGIDPFSREGSQIVHRYLIKTNLVKENGLMMASIKLAPQTKSLTLFWTELSHPREIERVILTLLKRDTNQKIFTSYL